MSPKAWLKKARWRLERLGDFKPYWIDRKYPTVVYVETCNLCNAHCGSCLYDNMVEAGEKKQGIMSLDDFKQVADKVNGHGLKINAMFCLGEPLLDPTLFKKYEYGNQINVFTGNHVGLNTNVSLLTAEKFNDILTHTSNITLSFFNTGEAYEKLTGGLSWPDSYGKALAFIAYRDKVRPSYPIFIGCNAIQGSDFKKVKTAFKGCNVVFVTDAELRWFGKILTGVIDRAIMFNDWVCDGHRGAMHVDWNGDCKFCAYDVVHRETYFGNIFRDSWGELEDKFKELWAMPSGLCARCDYYHLYWKVRRAGFRYVEDYGWQRPYLSKGEMPKR